MAIVKGIEPEAILWKYTKMEQIYGPIYEQGRATRYGYQEAERYYVIRLHTRRARSIGTKVGKDLYPFLSKLRIQLNPHGLANNPMSYTAVGTRTERIRTKEEWDSLQVDEIAHRLYQKLRNDSLSTILDRRKEEFSLEIIEEMKSVGQDDTSEVQEWPAEPYFQQYERKIDEYAYVRYPRWN